MLATSSRELPLDLNDVVLVFACNELFVPYLSVALQSILVNASPNRHYDIVVLTRDITPKKAVDFAHCYGVPVEAELGALKGKEDDHVSEADCHTDPAQVEEFCDRTGCDSLAVSIGNVHGLQEKPKIDLNVLAEISKVAPVPLVLHGGSGIPFETIRAMRQYGMMKINIASDLRQAYIRAVARRYEENHGEANLVSVLMDARNAVSEMAYDLAIEINKDVLIGKFAEQVA